MGTIMPNPDTYNPRILTSGELAMSLLVVLFSATNAYSDLIFLRATRDKQTYVKNPTNYERIVFPPSSGREAYAERTASLTIKIDEIESVLVEKNRMDRDLQKATEEASQLMGREKKEDENSILYTVTFSLNKQAAIRLRDLARKYDREMFAVRFKSEMLALPTLVGPFEGKNFSLVGLTDDTIIRLKEIFSPIKEKVIWK